MSEDDLEYTKKQLIELNRKVPDGYQSLSSSELDEAFKNAIKQAEEAPHNLDLKETFAMIAPSFYEAKLFNKNPSTKKLSVKRNLKEQEYFFQTDDDKPAY